MLASISLALAVFVSLGDGPKPIDVRTPKIKGQVSYTRDVADVLESKCSGCHSSALAESRLNMESVALMIKGGKHGPALVSGKADDSLLFKMAAHRVEPVMPPKEKKDLKPLTPDELGLLKLWIDAGAKDDSDAEPAAAAKPIELGALPPGVHPINALDMTADGRRVAAGRANVVQVYDVDSGLELARLGGHRDLIQSVRYAPDGKRLAAGSYQIVTLWNVPTGGPEHALTSAPELVKSAVALGDGKTLVVAGAEKGLRYFDLSNGKLIRVAALPAATEAIALSPDGKRIAALGVDGVLRLIDVASDKELQAIKGVPRGAASLAFHGDGGSIAVAGLDGVVRIWALAGKPGPPRLIPVAPGKALRALVMSKDGKSMILAAADGVIRFVTIADGKEGRSIAVPGGEITAFAVSADAKSFAVASADRACRLIDAASGKVTQTFSASAVGSPIRTVAISPKGDRIATGSDNGAAIVWDVATGRALIAFSHPAAKPGDAPAPIARVALLGAGRLLTLAEKSARTWTFEGDWSEARTFGPHAFRVLAIDFSPDGKLMATGGGEPSRSGEVKIWEVATGKLVRSLDALHSDTVFGVRFSPDGAKLASVAADKFLKITKVADGKDLKSLEGHTHHVLAVDWKSDGKQLATGGADSAVKFWDYETGEQLPNMRTTAGKQVTGLRWVPGTTRVVTSSGDMTVREWNASNGSSQRSYGGMVDYVLCVAASSDGGRVAAGAADGFLRVWSGQGGQLLRAIAPESAK